MIKRAKSLKKEPFIKKYMGTSIMPGSKILDRKSLANIWDIHNAQMSSVHEEEELKEFNPNFGRDAQAGRGSTQTGERDRIVKDQKDKEKEIQSLKNDIMLLKNKLENEKNKAVKPEPNPETGEVPLTVGIAYKVFKDQEKKKIEKVKNIPNKFKLKEKYLGERAYRIKFDNVDGAIGHREADAVQDDLKKMGFSARVNLTGHAKDELFFNTGVEKDQMKRLLTKAGYDLAEAVIAGKDYKYDGIGPIKISKKMYAKVQRDSKGKDFSGKPYMMALNPKTQETELVPVKFEEVDNSLMAQATRVISKTSIKEKIDPADIDMRATDADRKAADKNIIIQLRRAQDMVKQTGRQDQTGIEFLDRKKQKVDSKIINKALDMFDKMKPNDKAKMQKTIGKSYRDLLKTVQRGRI